MGFFFLVGGNNCQPCCVVASLEYSLVLIVIIPRSVDKYLNL